MFYNIKNPFVDENKQGTNEIYNITTVNEVNYLLNKINGELTNVIAYSEFDMDEFNKINEYYKNMKNTVINQQPMKKIEDIVKLDGNTFNYKRSIFTKMRYIDLHLNNCEGLSIINHIIDTFPSINTNTPYQQAETDFYRTKIKIYYTYDSVDEEFNYLQFTYGDERNSKHLMDLFKYFILNLPIVKNETDPKKKYEIIFKIFFFTGQQAAVILTRLQEHIVASNFQDAHPTNSQNSNEGHFITYNLRNGELIISRTLKQQIYNINTETKYGIIDTTINYNITDNTYSIDLHSECDPKFLNEPGVNLDTCASCGIGVTGFAGTLLLTGVLGGKRKKMITLKSKLQKSKNQKQFQKKKKSKTKKSKTKKSKIKKSKIKLNLI